MRIYLISDNVDTRTGLRLVGVDGAIVHERAEMAEALSTALSDRDIGIIAVTEKLAAYFPDLLDEIRLERPLPLVVEIPDRHGTNRRPDFLTHYVREAIGIKL